MKYMYYLCSKDTIRFHQHIQIWMSGGLQDAKILSCTTWYCIFAI